MQLHDKDIKRGRTVHATVIKDTTVVDQRSRAVSLRKGTKIECKWLGRSRYNGKTHALVYAMKGIPENGYLLPASAFRFGVYIGVTLKPEKEADEITDREAIDSDNTFTMFRRDVENVIARGGNVQPEVPF